MYATYTQYGMDMCVCEYIRVRKHTDCSNNVLTHIITSAFTYDKELSNVSITNLDWTHFMRFGGRSRVYIAVVLIHNAD